MDQEIKTVKSCYVKRQFHNFPRVKLLIERSQVCLSIVLVLWQGEIRVGRNSTFKVVGNRLLLLQWFSSLQVHTSTAGLAEEGCLVQVTVFSRPHRGW